ncbi:hypothetical protein HN51_030256 [Arachis hypogaea]|uniref:F-box domain-containing protein n=1 Tax=Arachis hypogaea TaxID=3818 RepID=A0A445BBW1_ARAHY|nr:putative FBD-associated F-box protein At5g38570 [Arachis hypogaea]QHO14722.1 F-box/FBD/LRR-repeat protein [Arachis hypogaea]RYR36163.1 hypothetical protein Ahy_A10g051193 [Arachis hypogaea]
MADTNPLCKSDDGIISSLPDSVLFHILSFLPTSTSVRTCILSHRWRHLWKDLQFFNFSFIPDLRRRGGESPEKQHSRFLDLVNAVLVQRNPLQIRNLSLVYRPSWLDLNKDAVTGWVEAAIGPRLEELRLTVWSGKIGFRFVVPPGVFSCRALVNLNLDGVTLELTPEASSSIHLPSLKTLRLFLDSPDNVDSILSGCPLLETLHLIIQRFQHCAPNISAFKIHVPSLKRLEFIDSGDSGIVRFKLDAPSLEYLFIRLWYPFYCQFSVTNMRNVVEARVDCLIDDGYFGDKFLGIVPKLLHSLCQTRSLVLEGSTVKALLRAPIVVNLPEFRNLSNLEMNLKSSNNTSLLLSMLDRCGKLHVLTIYKDTYAADAPRWIKPASVPKCLESHLLVVKFSRYHGNSGDLELIAYILQNGLVLTSMTIETIFKVDPDQHRHVTEQFCHMPKGSNTCHLNVVAKNFYCGR